MPFLTNLILLRIELHFKVLLNLKTVVSYHYMGQGIQERTNKEYLPQILLGPFLNTLTHISFMDLDA